MSWTHKLYILFLGVLLAATANFTITTLYPAPTPPQYPSSYNQSIPSYCYDSAQAGQSEECKKAKEEDKKTQDQYSRYQKEQDNYTAVSSKYSRTVTFATLLTSIAFGLVGLALFPYSQLVANGLLLGGALSVIAPNEPTAFPGVSVFPPSVGGVIIETANYFQLGLLLVLTLVALLFGHYQLRRS